MYSDAPLVLLVSIIMIFTIELWQPQKGLFDE